MRWMRWTWVLALTSLTSLARPGNFERYPIGANRIAQGGTGASMGQEPWHNPAGLGQVSREGLSASVSAYGLTLEKAPSFVSIGPIEGQLTNSSIDVIAASLGYVKPLGTAWGLQHGLGLSVVLPDHDEFDGEVEVPATQL